MEYGKHESHALCIIGAGFSLANSRPYLPSTANLIPETVNVPYASSHFPVLKYVHQKIKEAGEEDSLRLDSFWKNIYSISEASQKDYFDVRKAVEIANCSPYIKRLIRERTNINSFISTLLEVELKKMICYWYSTQRVQGTITHTEKIKEFLEKNGNSKVSWLALNYDTVLEELLSKHQIEWNYWFDDWIGGNQTGNSQHVLIKPHGSNNIWFQTEWSDTPKHRLTYASNNKLTTCGFEKIGMHEKKLELRPWLVGYVPDVMKDEINSPGGFADSAHDLCKANLSCFSFTIQKATSLYILGYSMPNDDEWVIKRLMQMDRQTPVYIASGPSSEKICKQFRNLGFQNVEMLTKDGLL